MSKFCSDCGSEINDDAVVCPNCGCSTSSQVSGTEDKANTGLVILSVLFPIIGIILWPVKHRKTPKAARIYGLSGIISWAVYFLFLIIAGGF